MVRVKRRYIVVKIIPERKETEILQFKDAVLTKCILNAVKRFHGLYGLAMIETGFRVKYCNDRTKIAIIRCSHDSYKYVTSILPFITLIAEVRAKFHTIYVGATITKCNKFIVKHQQNFLDRMLEQIESAKEKNDLIKRVMRFEAVNTL